VAKSDTASKGAESDDDFLADVKGKFRVAADCEQENRLDALDDIRFALLDDQWPDEIRKQRELDGRPCLTINRLRPVIKQVVNDARQNSPAITVHPVDSNADPETAEIISGLIRNIENVSDADVAYDTAIEQAVSGGFGYFRINIDYADDDTFDKDILIDAIPNAFSVFGDPYSTKADSSDWNDAFVVEAMPKAEFIRRFKDAEEVDWDAYTHGLDSPWWDGGKEEIQVAEYWHREEVLKPIVGLTSGEVVPLEVFVANQADYEAAGVSVVGKPRPVRSHKVTQYLMTGAEVLETVDWPGKYIPIIPVYGEVVNIEGRRVLRSLIRGAKDAQRMHNYWRTTSTELVALAPKTPFIGAKGQFKTDSEKWATANNETHAYIEYDPVNGAGPPQRQPFAGPPAGALQEALNASDDIKAITGIYDASLGARSNETSGKAIMARQREGDVSTFNFIDNLSRAIRHAGRVIIDLIPHIYSSERVIRVLGIDPKEPPRSIPLKRPVPVLDNNGQPQIDERGQPITRIYDLTVGKYDLTVRAGPSFTSQREEAATQMIELMRAFPAAAAVIGDLVAQNLDWPGADQIAERLKGLLPENLREGGEQGIPPEIKAQIEQGAQLIQQLQQQLADAQSKADDAAAQNALKAEENKIKAFEAETDRYEAQTARLQADAEAKRLDAEAMQQNLQATVEAVVMQLMGRTAA